MRLETRWSAWKAAVGTTRYTSWAKGAVDGSGVTWSFVRASIRATVAVAPKKRGFSLELLFYPQKTNFKKQCKLSPLTNPMG